MANGELSDHIMASIVSFYGSSEVLSYSSPQFPVDDTSIVERIVKEALKETRTKLRNLLTWSAGWNGYDSLGSQFIRTNLPYVFAWYNKV